MTKSDCLNADLIKADSIGRLIDYLVNNDLKHSDETTACALVTLHNEQKINFTSPQNLRSISALSHNDFWSVQHQIERTVEQLECTSLEVIRLVETLVTKAGDDMAATWPYRSLVKWFHKNPKAAKEAIAKACELESPYFSHCVFAIEGLGDAGIALDLQKNAQRECPCNRTPSIGKD